MKKADVVAMVIATPIATWLGCGYFPIGPGTVASAAALLIATGLHAWLGWPPFWFAILAAAFLAPSIWSANVIARVTGKTDPGLVVIDEVIGQWITIAAAASINWRSVIAAFVLFRLFDIWKPPPVRQLEGLPGGWGIVADDVMAGIYGAVVIFIAGLLHLY